MNTIAYDAARPYRPAKPRTAPKHGFVTRALSLLVQHRAFYAAHAQFSQLSNREVADLNLSRADFANLSWAEGERARDAWLAAR